MNSGIHRADADHRGRTNGTTVYEIIGEARRPSADSQGATCDAGSILMERAAYWRPLAEDQERWMTVDIPPHRLPVRVPEADLTVCIDILLENVFAHTPEGTAFSVKASPRAGGGAWLVVSDNGPRVLTPRSSQARRVERRVHRARPRHRSPHRRKLGRHVDAWPVTTRRRHGDDLARPRRCRKPANPASTSG